jgi:hypothetical protein
MSDVSVLRHLLPLAALLWLLSPVDAAAEPGRHPPFHIRDDGGRPDWRRPPPPRPRDFDEPPPPHFRPPPPPPPLPPRPPADHEAVGDDGDGFVPPQWLPEWVASARRSGYSDNDIAVFLERRPLIGRYVRRARAQGISDERIFASLGLTRWQAAAGGPVPAPAAPAPLLTTPNIIVPAALQTVSNAVRIAGRIDGHGRVVSFTIDGSSAPFNSDRSFSFDRAVPMGDSVVKLAAVNEWGQAAEALVVVSRAMGVVEPARFEPLNPYRLKGRKQPKAVALIIGVDQYESVPRAEYAENDAKAFYDYAVTALGIPKDRILLLTGQAARRLAVEKALQTWVKPLVAKGGSDVTVFFSGHGLASDDGRDLFLLPYDGDRGLLSHSAIRRKELVETLMAAGAASATLFLDTCYSGGTRGNEALIVDARPVLLVAKEQSLPDKVTILAAAGNDQLSSALAPVRHGLFSYFLMKGLEGAAAPGERSITADALAAYLADQIPSEAARLGRRQTPQLLGDGGRVLSSW